MSNKREYWISRRIKRKHDGRRRKVKRNSIKYIPFTTKPILLLCEALKIMKLIGKKIKGFKFEKCSVYYNDEMDNFIGVEGIITSLTEVGYCVLFDNKHTWTYPKKLVEEYFNRNKLD